MLTRKSVQETVGQAPDYEGLGMDERCRVGHPTLDSVGFRSEA